jgi:2',3'-cyclic-nucleotide 2'-phosphodiesterase (5'-nucleotidase family)
MKLPRLATLCIASLLAASCARLGQPDTFTLSIVGTNDLHGGIFPVDDRGGIALLGGYLANLREARRQDSGAVLLLDAGDLFKGTLESDLNEGAVVIDAYNALGYHAATIGNHEFDYGPVGTAAVPHAPGDDPQGALKARLAQARFPWVAANLVESATQRSAPFPNVSPSALLTINGVRIGIVGLLTEPAMSLTIAANVTALAVKPITPTLAVEAQRLRDRGASIVIALTHAGGACTSVADPADLSSCGLDEEMFRVVRELPAHTVDAVVAGHRHEQVAHDVNGVPMIESWSRGRAFGRIDLQVERAGGRAVSHRIFPPQELCGWQVAGRSGCARASAPGATVAQYEGGAVHPSDSITAIVQPAVDAAAALKARPLNAEITAPLRIDESEQSAVGDLEADWMRAVVPGADIALANSGGVRADLDEGPLTYGKLYELLPFDNLRVVITLTGAQLRTVIANNVQRRGSMVILSGVSAHASCAGSQVTVALRRNNGRPVRDEEVLRVVTTDFLATGGDSFFTPVMPLQVESTGDVLRDEMAAFIMRTGGRWGEERLALPRRVTIEGTRPLACGRG